MKNLICTTILYFVIFQCLVSTSYSQDFSNLNTISSADKIECVGSGEKFAANIDEMTFHQKEISNIEMMATSGGDGGDALKVLVFCGVTLFAVSLGAL